jgi:hypothetical protein
MSPIILQTSDPTDYFPMLVESSRTTRTFCRRHDMRYECYVGIKRGYWNWHATYNRIPMFNELIAGGFRDWAIYIDADAYVAQMDFPIKTYLNEKSEFSAIMIPSRATSNFWDVNAGVLLLNLARPTARFLAQEWLYFFEKIPDEILRQGRTPFQGDNDQVLLHNILAENKHLWPEIYLESPELMNSAEASFIRQHLRAYTSSLTERTYAISLEVDKILGETSRTRRPEEEWEVAIGALYRAILGRPPDKAGLSGYVSVIKKRGLSAGLEHTARWLLGSPEYNRPRKDA